MRPALPPFMRTALILAILFGFALTLARAVPADAPLQVQLDSGLTPPTAVPSSSSSSTGTGHIGHSRGWRALVRGAWAAFATRPTDAERGLHAGRRGRYLRRGRAHP